MAKKKYTVNVHYDYCATVEVIADEDDDILALAEDKAEMVEASELQYCDFIESCITDEEEIE